LSSTLLESLNLKVLIDRLTREHKDFLAQVADLKRNIETKAEFDLTRETFATVKNALIEHMLTEETEIFPEVAMRGLFAERISEIMQQHVEITAASDKMKFALHRRDIESLREGFSELLTLLKVHFPAEEDEVFSIVAQSH
jgi:hemerythrin